MVHELKIDPEMFDALVSGEKTHELRFDDRGYAVDDTLWLFETKFSGAQMKAGSPLEYTGREMSRQVSHILRGPIFGLAAGWVILSLG